MNYTVRHRNIGKTTQLDALALEAGRVYSQTVTTFWRVVRRKGVWLKPSSMMRLVNDANLHAHTIDATVQAFYASLKSWRARRKSDPDSHPPRRRRKFFRVEYKATAIKLKNGHLHLANGRGNEPLIIYWPHPLPRTLTIHWTGTQYEAIAVYERPQLAQPIGDQVAGVDLGEIHMAVSYDGEQTIILNGRYLRSVRQYQNKLKAKLSARIDVCKRGSLRRKQLIRTKRKQLAHVKNQIRDIEHKQTTKLVSALHQAGAQTLAVGDVRNIRQGLDFGHSANQRLHQWAAGKTRFYLTYKAERLGMKVEVINEAYTSQSCPACGHRYKPSGRNYHCKTCGFKFHRDGVGAWGIRAKYLACGPVVGLMARPLGILYTDVAHSNMRSHPALAGVECHLFPGAKAFVGEPFNDAARRIGRVQAQQVSSACNRKIIKLLGYKLGSCSVVNEAWSSQTCPGCGRRSKHQRVYNCRGCGLSAPRDVVGCTNILSIGVRGVLVSGCAVPNSVHWSYPSKYPATMRVVRGDTAQVAGLTIQNRPL